MRLAAFGTCKQEFQQGKETRESAMSTDDATINAALEEELRAAGRVNDWADAQPKSWHWKKLLLAVVVFIPILIYGKMDAVSGYYITTQLWPLVTEGWHLLATALQHAFRGVIEGVYGGIALNYFRLDAFKEGVLSRWRKYEDRLTVGAVIADLFKVFVWATLGFAVGYTLLYADQHNASVHGFFSGLAPANLLHIHVNLEQYLSPKVWVRLSDVLVSDTPMMLVGLAAAHLGRPHIKPILWEFQGYWAARAVLKHRPDRWYHLKGYCKRKQLFRILGEDAARQEVSEVSKTIRFLVPVIIWASVFAFLGGLYIMLVVAQHSVIHIGSITLD